MEYNIHDLSKPTSLFSSSSYFSSLFTSSLFLKHYKEVVFLLRFSQLFILPENSPIDILKANPSLPSDITQSYLTGESTLLLTLHIPLG